MLRRSSGVHAEITGLTNGTKPCVADWNGDGRLDLLVGDYAGDRHGHVWLYACVALTK